MAVVIALLSLIVEPWSTSWWAALTIATIVATAAASHILSEVLPSTAGRRQLFLVIFGTALMAIGGGIGLVGAFQMDSNKGSADQKHPPIDLTKNEGVLLPDNLLMPPAPKGCEIPDDALAIFYGGSVTWTQRDFQKVFKMAGEDMLVFERRNGSIVLTLLRIYDDGGSIIARIDEDGFWVAPQVRKKRPDKSTLIVYDQRDIEVLRLHFLNPRALSVQGMLRNPKLPGYSVTITNEFVRYMPGNFTLSGNCTGNAQEVLGFEEPRKPGSRFNEIRG